MKKEIHPKYFDKTKVKCSCGADFEVGSTIPEIKVEICSNCHPLYTGNKKLVDTAGRVDRFKMRLQKSQSLQKAKTAKAEEEQTVLKDKKTEEKDEN